MSFESTHKSAIDTVNLIRSLLVDWQRSTTVNLSVQNQVTTQFNLLCQIIAQLERLIVFEPPPTQFKLNKIIERINAEALALQKQIDSCLALQKQRQDQDIKNSLLGTDSIINRKNLLNSSSSTLQANSLLSQSGTALSTMQDQATTILSHFTSSNNTLEGSVSKLFRGNASLGLGQNLAFGAERRTAQDRIIIIIGMCVVLLFIYLFTKIL